MINFENILKVFSINKLAEWGDIFNHWDWPSDFLIQEPEDWENLPRWDNNDNVRTQYKESKPYRNAIENIIGRKESLRYHHIHNLKKNNFQFEVWWFVDNINGFILKYINNNFYFNVYDFMKWRNEYREEENNVVK